MWHHTSFPLSSCHAFSQAWSLILLHTHCSSIRSFLFPFWNIPFSLSHSFIFRNILFLCFLFPFSLLRSSCFSVPFFLGFPRHFWVFFISLPYFFLKLFFSCCSFFAFVPCMILVCLRSDSDPNWFRCGSGSIILGQCVSGSGSTSKVLMTKN